MHLVCEPLNPAAVQHDPLGFGFRAAVGRYRTVIFQLGHPDDRAALEAKDTPRKMDEVAASEGCQNEVRMATVVFVEVHQSVGTQSISPWLVLLQLAEHARDQCLGNFRNLGDQIEDGEVQAGDHH